MIHITVTYVPLTRAKRAKLLAALAILLAVAITAAAYVWLGNVATQLGIVWTMGLAMLGTWPTTTGHRMIDRLLIAPGGGAPAKMWAPAPLAIITPAPIATPAKRTRTRKTKATKVAA